MNCIRRLIELKNAPQKELAIFVGVSQPTVSEWIHGKKDPSGERLDKVAEFFGVDWRVVKCLAPIPSAGSNPSSNALRVPVLGTIPAGVPLEAIEDILDWEEVPAEWSRGNAEFFALEIHGDSMVPEYLDGDIVIFKRQADCSNGDDCAVMVNSDDATFKRVRLLPDGMMLKPLNSSYDPLFFSTREINTLPVHIVGVAVEVRRKVKRSLLLP